MGKEEILQQLDEFSEDMDWISETQKKLRKKFADKYIAVMNSQVIESDSDLDTLLQKLKEAGRNPSSIPIEFISREPQRLIL